jgi:lipopolysaccharide/colanic/teichoic acid biosynthesis glycosyltransferase
LFNVLKGDMSVVGPRPERPHFTKIYKKQYGTYRYRSAVKAGLTGLAQVAGKYETDVEDKLRYDLYYIRNYSVLFDIIIIFRTIRVILDKQKASGISLKKVPLKKEKDVRA